MRIIAISGTKNTGKTTLVTKIVSELVKRDFKVGTVKHTHHGFDTEGKDTWKHNEAGSEIVVGSGNETFFTLKEKMDLDTILSIIKFIKNPDFVVLEGFKQSKYAKICTSPIDDEFTLAIVDVFEIDQNDLESLVDLIEERSYGILQNLDYKKYGFKTDEEFAVALINGEMKSEDLEIESEILLRIDNAIIPMNLFVQDFLKNTVQGAINSLKIEKFGAKDIKKIELLINENIK